MRTFARNTDEAGWPAPGEYRAVNTEDGRKTAVITCPGCGVPGSLGGSHDVGPDGVVHPSVHCDCGFHEFIRLEGWGP